MKTQIESMLLNPKIELINETIMNYNRECRIEYLKKRMRVYKAKNRELYKMIQREYLDLIR
jgi:hypothetical protein